MTPVIRIDDEVMDELKKQAINKGLVFSTPNDVLRAILGLDKNKPVEPGDDKEIMLHMNKLYTPRRWALIPIPRNKRGFFPGYKVKFELVTDIGIVITHVTAAPRGTPFGDPQGGGRIQGGLRQWYNKHIELKDGATLRIEVLEPRKRYKLSIV